MIVNDYANTFYINDNDIKNNVSLVSSFMKDNIFVIATKRSLYDYKNKQNLYNIKSNYIIVNHGTTILKNDKVIYNKTINNEVKNKLLEDLDLKSSISYFACNESESRINFSNDNLTKIHVRYSTPEQEKKYAKKELESGVCQEKCVSCHN